MTSRSEEEDSKAEKLMAEQMAGFDPNKRNASSDPIGAHVVDWRHLSDANASVEWEGLRRWVEWFVARYRVAESTVPPCWYKHGQLVEELSALHTAHTAAFDSTDAGFGPIGWHERLALALPRLTRAYAGGCTTGHRDVQPRTSVTTDVRDWDAWTNWAHAN